MIRSNQLVCSFFVYPLLIFCTVTVICATPVMRSLEVNKHSPERFTNSLSNEREKIASKYFGKKEKLEWQNPCGGNFVLNELNGQAPKPTLSDEIDALKNVKINIDSKLQSVENQIHAEESFDPLELWMKHEENYRFLPTLNYTHAQSQGSSDASFPHVKRRPQLWHRDLQIFIGAFQYLYKQQLAADIESNNGTEKSKMLSDLMFNAKSLLCEIEILVNNTAHTLRKPRGRTEMGNILQFEVDNPTRTSQYLDRRFTNQMYKQYISELLHVVTKRLNRKEMNLKLQQSGQPIPTRNSQRRHRLRFSNESNNRRKGENLNSGTNISSNKNNRIRTSVVSNESRKMRGNNSRNRSDNINNRGPQHRRRTGQKKGNKRMRKTTTIDPFSQV